MISIDGSFHIGDKVVYPNHGVGIIEQISSRTIGASVEKFYLLKIKASSLKVMVPFHNVASVGLRRGVRNGEIQKILDFLTDGEWQTTPPRSLRIQSLNRNVAPASRRSVSMSKLMGMRSRHHCRRDAGATETPALLICCYRLPWCDDDPVVWPALA